MGEPTLVFDRVRTRRCSSIRRRDNLRSPLLWDPGTQLTHHGPTIETETLGITDPQTTRLSPEVSKYFEAFPREGELGTQVADIMSGASQMAKHSTATSAPTLPIPSTATPIARAALSHLRGSGRRFSSERPLPDRRGRGAVEERCRGRWSRQRRDR